MIISPIMSLYAYDTDDEKAVIESPAVSDNDISEDKSAQTHEIPKVKAASGTCGENVTWTLDDEGTLTISGTGDMTDFISYYTVPWYSNRLNVKKVVIENGVTSIGARAFYESSNLTSITIGNGVNSIGDSAFCDCDALTNVYYNGSEAVEMSIKMQSKNALNNKFSKNAYIFD